MIYKFFNWFTKITAWPVQFFAFRTKIYYEDRESQGRKIKGPAVIVSNHTSVFDYAVLLFVFFSRTCRYLVAELQFEKKILGPFMKMLGAIRVDRNSFDISSVQNAVDVLDAGGVVGIFPESRIPLPGEEKPLEFKTGAALISLMAGVRVIPVYTDGCYFKRKRARVIIGAPLEPSDYTDDSLSDRENIANVTKALREKIIMLERLLHEKEEK